MAILQGSDVAIPGGPGRVELIDVIFAFSNVKLVRELVQDHIRQLEEMGRDSKGQTEGLRQMIIEKQKVLYANLSEVEKMLGDAIDMGVAPRARAGGMRNIRLNAEQSKAMVSAIVFAINHMAKFVPGAGPGEIGLPESVL